MTDISQFRKAEFPVEHMIISRWSPRAMSGEPITHQELMSLFEAARWAPSSFNGQPWRFLYALRDTEAWPRFFDLLVEFNQQWCKNAAALFVIIARQTFEHNNKPNPTHPYDTGAAWQNFALQGNQLGLVVHGMAGFDYDRAKQVLGVPEGYTVMAMAAVGRPGNPEELPPDLAQSEQPSSRKAIQEFAFEGKFRQP